MYEAYVSLRTLLRFFLSPSAGAVFLDVFFAALSAVVVFAGALEAVEAGALPAVDAGLGAIAKDEGSYLRKIRMVVRVWGEDSFWTNAVSRLIIYRSVVVYLWTSRGGTNALAVTRKLGTATEVYGCVAV